MCGRLSVGKDFLGGIAVLVGAAMCPASHEGLSVKHFRCGTVD
jgi:hypothetical protein